MTKSNSKTPLVFRLGVVLLCAMLITTHMMGNLYARYSTTATGEDGARVAKFKVTIELPEPKEDYPLSAYEQDKNALNYEIKVTSESEVAVSYDVILVFGEDFPAWIPTDNIKLDTDTTAKKVETAADGTKTYTFEKVGTLQPNETTPKEHILHILMPSMADMNNSNSTDRKDIENVQVTVIVRASQVD